LAWLLPQPNLNAPRRHENRSLQGINEGPDRATKTRALRGSSKIGLILALLAAFAMWTPARADPPAPSSNIEWTDSLDDGYLRSQINNHPIFVLVGSDRVETSRLLSKALHSSDWSAQLQQWTTVQLSSDAISPAVRSLGVVGVPAVRLFSPDGRLLAAHDGFISVEEFSAWWLKQKEHYELPSPGPVSADEIPVLLSRLGDADVAVRESAIRQLHDHPDSAPQIIDLLHRGSLSQRLSAVDLLEQWSAPMAGVDAWQPSTLTPERITELRKWAGSHSSTQLPKAIPGTAPAVSDELDALILAPTEIQARAVRQRLVKFGPTILPQVYSRLGKSPREPGRHRLMALRYRLVATESLASDWPGGFDRLASADSEIRRTAITDLTDHAKPQDHRLLSELFGDQDPFIRAQSLKLLRSLGGADTNREMMSLLADPEPNVRAAVLDTFAETPDPSAVADLMRYAGAEKNTDLVVHVVHVLEQTTGPEAFDGLLTLLKHPQWRVRGEAAESLRGKLRSSGVTDEQKDAANNALVKLLDDPDGYVVNRAAGTLIKCSFEVSARALMARVQNRPDLARDVLKAIADDPSVGKTVLPQIRKMTASTQPAVRIGALAALASLAPADCGVEMSTAVRDPDPLVREAALHGAQTALAAMIPGDPPAAGAPNPLFGGVPPQVSPTLAGIAAFRLGRGRPQWLNDMEPQLEQALRVDATRIPAATILCSLGKEDLAMPVLLNAQRGEVPDAAEALVWLPWQKKIQLFRVLKNLVGISRNSAILDGLAFVPDPRVTDELWNQLGPAAKPEEFEPIFQVLRKMVLGENYYNADGLPDDQKNAMIAALLKRVNEGADLQRSSALAMLMVLAPQRTIDAAKTVRDDPHATEWGRLDALQIQLLLQQQDAAEQTAVAAMNEPGMWKVAIPYLAAGPSTVSELRGAVSLSYSSNYSYGDNKPITVQVPTGLDSENSKAILRKILKGDDIEMAGYAGYLLALVGDRSGFDILLSDWRSNNMEDAWSRMVYRAIAKDNDDTQTAVLKELYNGYAKGRSYRAADMYWTLQNVTGPNTKAFLKSIANDLGVSSDNTRIFPPLGFP
jgi:HEAT repeat protein